MQTGNDFYTSREEAEALLKQTLDVTEPKGSEPKAKKTVNKRVRIVKRSFYALIILAMVTMLGIVWYQKLNNQVPSLFGYQIYMVETGSMVPTLPIGTNIVIRQLTDTDQLKVGDIVTYSHSEAAVTHRIVDLVVGDDGITRYQTKGDNPDNSLDPWLVERADIRGVLVWQFSLSNLLGK